MFILATAFRLDFHLLAYKTMETSKKEKFFISNFVLCLYTDPARFIHGTLWA
jgi:hypothetical protein